MFHIFCDMTFHSILTLKVFTSVYRALHAKKSCPAITVPLQYVSVPVEPQEGWARTRTFTSDSTSQSHPNSIRKNKKKKKWKLSVQPVGTISNKMKCPLGILFESRPWGLPWTLILRPILISLSIFLVSHFRTHFENTFAPFWNCCHLRTVTEQNYKRELFIAMLCAAIYLWIFPDFYWRVFHDKGAVLFFLSSFFFFYLLIETPQRKWPGGVESTGILSTQVRLFFTPSNKV